MDMEFRAHSIVLDYIGKHLDKSDNITDFGVYTVWKCKALQNWKFLISSTLLDGMYYEVTFNGDKSEWYLDAYKKFENQVIPEQTERIKTPDYCDICNHNGCDNCVANNLDDYCVPSGYEPITKTETQNSNLTFETDTPQTDCGWSKPNE